MKRFGIAIVAIAITLSGCGTTVHKAPATSPTPIVNAAELDAVSSWTSSIANKVVSDLAANTTLTPNQIFTHATEIKNAFPDGDVGQVAQTLRGARITFTLNQTSISKYLYLDAAMKLSSSDLLAPTSPQPIVGCFAAKLKSDNFYLDISKQDGLVVEGTISLNNAQKDSSYGDFIGSFDGTILTGMYRFMSEGVGSNRELFFKATDTGFVSGFGPVTEVGDSAKFIRPLNISWDESYIYSAQKLCK